MVNFWMQIFFVVYSVTYIHLFKFPDLEFDVNKILLIRRNNILNFRTLVLAKDLPEHEVFPFILQKRKKKLVWGKS